jgi:hypothetical protein
VVTAARKCGSGASRELVTHSHASMYHIPCKCGLSNPAMFTPKTFVFQL